MTVYHAVSLICLMTTIYCVFLQDIQAVVIFGVFCLVTAIYDRCE